MKQYSNEVKPFVRKYFEQISDLVLDNNEKRIFQRLILYNKILTLENFNQDICQPIQDDLLRFGLLVKRDDQLQVSSLLHKEYFNENWVEQQLKNNFIYQEILYWSEDNYFLQEKIINKVFTNEETIQDITKEWLETFIRIYIIRGWENTDEHTDNPLHLYWQSMYRSFKISKFYFDILTIYKKILQGDEINYDDDFNAQKALINSNLVANQNQKLVVAKRIYTLVFDLNWIKKELQTTGKPKVISKPPSLTKKTNSKWQKIKQYIHLILAKAKDYLILFFLALIAVFVLNFGLPIIIQTVKANEIKKIDKIAISARTQFSSDQLESLLLAVKSGEQLEKYFQGMLVKNKNILQEKLPLPEYPIVSPLFALQYIFENIYEINILNKDTINQNEKHDRYNSSIISLDFSTDGKYLVSANEEGSFIIWKLPYFDESNNSKKVTFKIIPAEKVAQNGIYDVSFTTHKNFIATAGKNGEVRLWNELGELQVKFQAYEQGEVKSINFSPDDNFMATVGGQQGVVKLWKIYPNYHQFEYFNTLKGNRSIESVSFSSYQNLDEALIVTAEEGGTVRLWTIKRDEKEEFPNLESSGINQIRFFSGKKRIITAGRNGRVKIWDLKGNFKTQLFEDQNNKPEYHNQIINISPDKELLATTGENGKITIIGLNKNKIEKINNLETNAINKDKLELNSHQGRIYSMDFSFYGDDIYLASSGKDKIIKLWKFSKPNKELKELLDKKIKIIKIGKVSDHRQRLVILKYNGNVEILEDLSSDNQTNYNNFKTIATLKNDSASFIKATTLNMALDSTNTNPNKSRFVTVENNGIVRRWDFSEDVNNQQGRWEKLETGSLIKDVVLGQKDDCVIITRNGKANIWNFSTESKKASLNDKSEGVISASFSPDGKYIVTGTSGKNIKLWSLSGKIINSNFIHINSPIKSVKFNPNGKQLVTLGNNGTVNLWKFYEEIVSPVSDQSDIDGVTIVEYSPNGELIATAGDNKAIKLWDSKGRQVAEFVGDWSKTVSLSFTPDSRRIIAVGNNGKVMQWKIEELKSLIKQGCEWLQWYLGTHEKIQQEQKVCL